MNHLPNNSRQRAQISDFVCSKNSIWRDYGVWHTMYDTVFHEDAVDITSPGSSLFETYCPNCGEKWT